MTEPLLITRQRDLLRELHAAVAERAAAEPQVAAEFEARTAAAEKAFQEGTQRVISRFETEKEAAKREFEDITERVTQRYDSEHAAQEKELHDAKHGILSRFEAEQEHSRAEFTDAKWQANTLLEANKEKADAELREAQVRLAAAVDQMKALRQQATELLRAWRQYREHDDIEPTRNPDRHYKDAFRQLEENLSETERHLRQLSTLRVPRLFAGLRPLWLFAVPFLLALGPCLWLTEDLARDWYVSVAVALGIGTVVGFALSFFLYRKASAAIIQFYEPFCRGLADAGQTISRCREQAQETHQALLEKGQARYQRDMEQITRRFKEQRLASKQRRSSAWKAAVEKFHKERAESVRIRDAELKQAHEKYQRLRTEIYERYENDSQQLHQQHYRQLSESRQIHEQQWNHLANRWREASARLTRAIRAIHAETDQLFPPWSSPLWKSWTSPTVVPPVLRLGQYRVDLHQIPHAIPRDPRLQTELPEEFTLPALVAFPDQCSLLLKACDEGRSSAIQVLQTAMVRLLTSLPPGKVRLTIIDPVGLGENFSAFMHLADYDEQLVTHRIWTETAHIEERLADLTQHMENVLQKYLRNQYQNIEEYNAMAGEVAEPYRIVVVANFPAGFSQDAARRLASIAASGKRCGVYTLVSVDTKLELPQGFQLSDLEPHAVNLTWNKGHFIWKEPDFQKYPLHLDAPPDAAFTTELLHKVGTRAREAKRVEVPFEFIAPTPDRFWAGDTCRGIDIPFGRAGATKRQHLRLGQGTAQHVLVAGKTGSGKSTLMHAVITNAALLYSPDQLELYLIDFKKGVEFKTYATHQLPHARVVAVESEREFGLSVLQRLDAELRHRGELFRQAGVPDLPSFRQARPGETLPRVLLIVDEFQEFFTEDDKLAQDAASLLDRLVRQGRAFGLHVLLGSQTLGGAFTLARATIDQMAVRIALQCSEADGHLILADDNSAARLLSRPGEAIYNDANGRVEGNNPFQVVWLADQQRENYLKLIHRLHEQRRPGRSVPQLVFEGNAPADVRKNEPLDKLLRAANWPESQRAFSAWLGEPVAIKEPTAAVFRPQSGSNLLLLGQQEEAALSILTTVLISLAAQHPPADEVNHTTGARFYVLDSTPVDSPHYGTLARLADVIPQPLRVVGWKDLPAVIAEVAEELDRRQKSAEVEGPSLYLCVHGLQRFRDLRRDEDDFGFGREEEKPKPARQFATILKEGSGLRVHSLVWCDSVNNLTRALDRQALREFDMRVLFQMGAGDSSNLIDSPAASKLGLHRALFHSEEQGQLEKFRPYGLPPVGWLGWVREQLRARSSVDVGLTASSSPR